MPFLLNAEIWRSLTLNGLKINPKIAGK